MALPKIPSGEIRKGDVLVMKFHGKSRQVSVSNVTDTEWPVVSLFGYCSEDDTFRTQDVTLNPHSKVRLVRRKPTVSLRDIK